MGIVTFEVSFMSENKQLAEKKDGNRLLLYRSLLTGFVGGILSGTLGVFMYYFNFSELTPRTYVLRVWLKKDWTSGWIGDLLSIFIIGLLSIFVALTYYIFLKRTYSLWLSGIYGLVLWLLIFIVIHPLYKDVQKAFDLSQDTIISTICLFIIYGIFIGYSISYDYHETNVSASKSMLTKS